MRTIKIGDSFAVGPCYALLDDGTVITGISLARAELKAATGGAVIASKTLGSGVTLVSATTGEMRVDVDSADTMGLVNGTEYVIELRVKTGAGKVYTVARAEFQAETAMTAVPS
jgi:hypothetical protein